jgi:hypothetical protein
VYYKPTQDKTRVHQKFPIFSIEPKKQEPKKKKHLFEKWYWNIIRSFIIVFVIPTHPIAWMLPLALVLNVGCILLEYMYLNGKFKKLLGDWSEKLTIRKKILEDNDDYIRDLFFNNVDEFKKEHEKIEEQLKNHKFNESSLKD